MPGVRRIVCAIVGLPATGYNQAMTRTWIKICGICDSITARAAVDAGADAIGLVFVPGSPRQVTVEQAQQIRASLPPSVEPVALFVDMQADQIRSIATELDLTLVQLHGRETPEDVAALAPLRVIKAVNVPADAIDATLAPWTSPPSNLAGLLFDAPQDGADLPGGSGRSFDWSSLASLDRTGWPRTIVAGGLTPQNVGHAIAAIHPWGVDVSSGAESARGVKDADLIEAFTKAVRIADGKLDGACS